MKLGSRVQHGPRKKPNKFWKESESQGSSRKYKAYKVIADLHIVEQLLFYVVLTPAKKKKKEHISLHLIINSYPQATNHILSISAF